MGEVNGSALKFLRYYGWLLDLFTRSNNCNRFKRVINLQLTIFYDFLQSSKKDLFKKNANYVTLVLNKLHVNVPTVLLCFASVPKIKSIQIRKLLSFVQSIASWFVFPPNSSWAGNSTLLQYTKTLLDLLNLLRCIFFPRPLTLTH